MKTENLKKYRYPGAVNFTRFDSELFKGRELDCDRLYTKVMLNRTVVLHSESGTGKSSLVQAALIPKIALEHTGTLPVLIRFIGNKISISLDDHTKVTKANELIVEVIDAIRKALAPDESLEKVTQSFRLWQIAKSLELKGKTMLLIFDQFEEIQSYSYTQIKCFKKALAELFSPDIPEDIYLEYNERIKENISEENMLRTLNKSLDLLEDPLKTNALFVVREDKLGSLSMLSDYLPDILKNDCTLLPLTREAAEHAIIDPALIENEDYHSPSFVYEKVAVQEILDNIQDESTGLIDPIQVQIVCSNIERNLVCQKDKRLVGKVDLPPIGDIIEDFYNQSWAEILKTLYQATPVRFHDDKRILLEELVVNNKRNLVNRDKLIQKGVDMKMVNALNEKGVIRQIDERSNTYYRLCHDRLILPLLENLDEILAIEHDENERRKLKDELKKKGIDHRNRIEAQKQLNRKKMNTFITTAAVIFTALSIMLFWLYMRNRNYGKNEEAKKIYMISELIKRTNPTLAYSIVRDFERAKGPTAYYKHYFNQYDSLDNAYLAASFPMLNDLLYADADSRTGKLSIFDKKSSYIWDLKSGIITSSRPFSILSTISSFKINGEVLFCVQNGIGFNVVNKNGKILKSFDARRENPRIVVSPNGRYILIDEILFEYNTNKQISRLPSIGTCASFFNDGVHLAVGYSKGLKRIFTISGEGAIMETQLLDSIEKGQSASITQILLDKTDRYLVAVNTANHIEIWKLPADLNRKITEPTILKGHSAPITQITISNDSRYVLSTSKDHSSIVSSLSDGKKISVLRAKDDDVIYGSFSSDGKTIITATALKRIYIWKIGKASSLYENHQFATFSPFNYYSLGLDEYNRKKVYGKTKNINQLFSNTISYFASLPVNNLYPEDGKYKGVLCVSISEVKKMYNELISRSDFDQKISRANKEILYTSYNRLMYNQSDLLQQNIDPMENFARRNLLDVRILLLDTLNINSALLYGYELNESGTQYRDGKRNYQASITYLNGSRSLLKAFHKKFPKNKLINDVLRECYGGLGLSYLYAKNTDSAKTVFQKLAMIPEGAPMADMRMIQLLLQEGAYDKAQSLFQNNKHKLVRNKNFTVQLLAALEKMVDYNIASIEVHRFIVFLKDKEK